MSEEKASVEKAPEIDVKAVEAYDTNSAENFDEAYKLGLETENLSYTSEEEARLLWKIDWHILPVLSIIYALQYVDKTTLSYSSIMGIETFANLVGDQYSWLGSIFYFGYLVWEYPTNRLMQTFPLAKYTAFNIIVWGAVLACMAGTQNFAGLMVVRFLLGMFEASILPGFALFTSQWYRKHEQGTRTGIWYSFQGIAQIVGGVVAYGIAVADSQGRLSIPGWKVIFVLTGMLTLGMGLVFLFVIPDSPVRARWLTDREKRIAIERIRTNQQGVGNKHFKFYQVKEAFTDLQVWLFCAYALLMAIPNGGITNYFSIVIEAMGFTSQQSLLYGAPGGAIQAIALSGLLWLGDRLKLRLFFSSLGVGLGVVGILLNYALADDLKVGKLIGWYLVQAYPAGSVAILSLISTNIAGFTKKTTVSAMYFVAYCVGNLIGPQVFQSKDAPKYTPALITIVVCWSICISILFAIWFVNMRENRRREEFVKTAEYVHVKNQEFLDLTDKENQDFRYAS